MIFSKNYRNRFLYSNHKKRESQFYRQHFLHPDGSDFSNGNQVIIEKFKMITGIEERRYAAPTFYDI